MRWLIKSCEPLLSPLHYNALTQAKTVHRLLIMWGRCWNINAPQEITLEPRYSIILNLQPTGQQHEGWNLVHLCITLALSAPFSCFATTTATASRASARLHMTEPGSGHTQQTLHLQPWTSIVAFQPSLAFLQTTGLESLWIKCKTRGSLLGNLATRDCLHRELFWASLPHNCLTQSCSTTIDARLLKY